jgi:hypothetical protein
MVRGGCTLLHMRDSHYVALGGTPRVAVGSFGEI